MADTFKPGNLARITHSPVPNSPNVGVLVRVFGHDGRGFVKITKHGKGTLVGLEHSPGGIAFARPEWLEKVEDSTEEQQ